VWGIVRELRTLGNGRLFLRVEGTGCKDGVVDIRGLTADPQRHPALGLLRLGNRVSVFNLRREIAGGTLSESPWTTIYKIPG
jgi:hypothetical protein